MNKSDDLKFRFEVPRAPQEKVVELTIEQTEQVLVEQLAAAKDNPIEAMWELAQFHKNHSGKLDRAFEQFRQLLERVPYLEAKAEIVLALGQTAERTSDYAMAEQFHRQALSMEPTSSLIWYFIHNNLGFSLNQLGRFEEGETCCRRAIGINAQRSNGHKNLGLSLQGQGRYREAAESFVASTQANASDARSLRHLEELLAEHPELQFDFDSALEACRMAVAVAKEAMEKANAAWRIKQK